MNVYIYRDDEQLGPYSLAEVQAYLDAGNFVPIDSAWYEGGAEWTTISNVPGIVVPDESLRHHLVPPFEAYSGDLPHIFVSYSHADGQLVFREILRLHDAGYRIWYDEGIEPGDDWPEHIAKAVIDCDLFLMFTSPRSAASENCRNEVNLALNRKKKFLAVYLEETDLPPGLELRMGDLQAIHKFKMPEATYRKKVFTGLENMLGEGGREVPEGEDPVAAAMAIELVADYLSVPMEDDEEDGYFPEPEQPPAKSNSKWVFIGLAIMACAAWVYFLDEFKQGSKPDHRAKKQTEHNQSRSTGVPLAENNVTAELAKEQREILAEAKRILAQIELEKQRQLDLLAKDDIMKKARVMVENSIGIANYFSALDQAKLLKAYEGESLLTLEKVTANQELFRNDDSRLNHELLFHGPDEVWDKIKAGELGLQPESSQSEYVALAALVNSDGIGGVWIYQHVLCDPVELPRTVRTPRGAPTKYDTKRTSLAPLFSFGQIQEEKTVEKFGPDGKPLADLWRLIQQGDFFIKGQRQHMLIESILWAGNVKGEIFEKPKLTTESRFTQEHIEKFLNDEGRRVAAPLLELVDLLLANETISVLFKAYVHDKLVDIIRSRGDQWGAGLTSNFIKDHLNLKTILNDNLKATDWMNPEPDLAMKERLTLFYQELGKRRYAKEAKALLLFLRSLPGISFRLVGRVDEFARPNFLDPENAPALSWCIGHGENEAVLQRFTGSNALPFSPLLGTDKDLEDLLELALLEAEDEVRDSLGGIENMIPFRYSEE